MNQSTIRDYKGESGFQFRKGYTLIEVLVYAGILAMLLLLVTQLFISIKLTNAQSVALGGLQKNFRQVATDLTQTIRGAEEVVSPLPGQSTSSLSLNEGGIVYALEDGVLKKTVGEDVWEITNKEVTITNLSFENVVEATQTAALQVAMTIEANYLLEGGRTLVEDFQTTISLR